MNTRQVVIGALVVAGVCCAVMWFLEDFNRQRMAAEWRDFLETHGVIPDKGASGGGG